MTSVVRSGGLHVRLTAGKESSNGRFCSRLIVALALEAEVPLTPGVHGVTVESVLPFAAVKELLAQDGTRKFNGKKELPNGWGEPPGFFELQDAGAGA